MAEDIDLRVGSVSDISVLIHIPFDEKTSVQGRCLSAFYNGCGRYRYLCVYIGCDWIGRYGRYEQSQYQFYAMPR